MMAVILAGGQGTRLLPLTTETPKPLVKLGDKTIIEYLLIQLSKSGFNEITLAVNHKADMIENVLGDGSRFGMTFKYSRESTPLSTIAPLTLIDNLEDNFIVVNSDILTDINFKKLYDYHIKSNAEITVATYQRDNKVDYGVFKINDDNQVTSFCEKPTFNYLVSTGIYVFSRSILDIVPKNQPYGFDQLMLDMLKMNKPINTYMYDGFWLDVGRVEDYLIAQNEIEKIKTLILK